MRGVDSLNWPWGQNPGRKPEGHQRALAREALSLGEQSSTCRASTSCGALPERLEFRPLMPARELVETYLRLFACVEVAEGVAVLSVDEAVHHTDFRRARA